MARWFAEHEFWFWAIAWASFAIFTIPAIAPFMAGLFSPVAEQRMTRRLPPWVFGAAAILCFLAFRWPVWCIKMEFNPDESQMMGEALALQHKPLFWSAADGATHGPLDVFPLVAIGWLGFRIDYFAVRIVGAILTLIQLAACYRTFAIVAKENAARVAVLPIFCVLAFTTYWDWVHYTSELVPVTLLTVGCWLILSDLERAETRKLSWRWLTAGLALGAVPMAKLQGSPPAALLIAGGVAFDLATGSISWQRRATRTAGFIAAAALPTAFFAATSLIFGAWTAAWNSYIVHNLHYTESGVHSLTQMWSLLPHFISMVDGAPAYALGATSICLLLAYALIATPGRGLRLSGLAALFLLGSLVATLTPGREYTHYLLFLISPLGLLAGAVWASAWNGAEKIPCRRLCESVLFLGLLAVVVPQIVVRAMQPHAHITGLEDRRPLEHNPVAQEVLRYGKPGEALGIWGWMCRYYVYTGMWQATRDGHSYTEILPSPQQEYFRWRYLHDLKRNRPPVFLDTTGPGDYLFVDRIYAHETFPALRDYIAREYRQVAEIDGCRIYVRLDRLK